MPQLFPANWINLSIFLILMIYLTMTLIFSSFTLSSKLKSEKIQKLNKHWEW